MKNTQRRTGKECVLRMGDPLHASIANEVLWDCQHGFGVLSEVSGASRRLAPKEFAARKDLVQALPDRNQAIPNGAGATPKPSRGGWAASASRTNNIKFDLGD
ncbi:hypothetical protein Tco_1170614 [Tanacetum coccineum]